MSLTRLRAWNGRGSGSSPISHGGRQPGSTTTGSSTVLLMPAVLLDHVRKLIIVLLLSHFQRSLAVLIRHVHQRGLRFQQAVDNHCIPILHRRLELGDVICGRRNGLRLPASRNADCENAYSKYPDLSHDFTACRSVVHSEFNNPPSVPFLCVTRKGIDCRALNSVGVRNNPNQPGYPSISLEALL